MTRWKPQGVAQVWDVRVRQFPGGIPKAVPWGISLGNALPGELGFPKGGFQGTEKKLLFPQLIPTERV